LIDSTNIEPWDDGIRVDGLGMLGTYAHDSKDAEKYDFAKEVSARIKEAEEKYDILPWAKQLTHYHLPFWFEPKELEVSGS
jgi:hypothetical protein